MYLEMTWNRSDLRAELAARTPIGRTAAPDTKADLTSCEVTFIPACSYAHCVPCRLTVKLRGRAEAPAIGAEGAQFLSARGANPEAPHGPLQRLLDVQRGLKPLQLVLDVRFIQNPVRIQVLTYRAAREQGRQLCANNRPLHPVSAFHHSLSEAVPVHVTPLLP